MGHKPTPADVSAAFERYRRITGDTEATLTIDRQDLGPWIYTVAGDLEGRFYGPAIALTALESYCTGYRDGREDGEAACARVDVRAIDGAGEITEVARRALIREAEARIDAGPPAGGVKRILPSPNQDAPPFSKRPPGG